MAQRFVNGLYHDDSAAVKACVSCLDSHGRSNPMDRTFDYLGRTWRMKLWQPGLADGTVPEWMRLGYPDKASWKRAGGKEGQAGQYVPGPAPSPLPIDCAPGYHIVGNSCVIDTTGGSGGGPGSGGTGKTGSGGGGIFDSISSAFSGIPTTYLLIGGAIVAVMFLKKR